jgi:flagellar biosynthesis/type III secretory pathway protein FliH
MGDYIEAKAIKKGMEQGMEQGIKRGISKGNEQAEIRFVRVQLEKMKRTPEETAELLDMPLGYIQKIADILQMYAGASDLQIAEKLVDMRI